MLQPDWLLSVWQFGDVRILKLTAFVPVMTIVLVALLLYIVHHTKPGLAMRAISKDIETTRLLGVRVDNIIAFTFFIGSALAAASGIMWALRYPQVHPYMGIMPGLKAFIAAVFRRHRLHPRRRYRRRGPGFRGNHDRGLHAGAFGLP